MTTPSSRRCSRKMFETATQLMQGYKDGVEHEVWISHQGIMYLTIYNVVYNIDLVGGYIARRKEDGELIPSVPV